MDRRRALAALSAVALTAAGGTSRAQRPGSVARIGLLWIRAEGNSGAFVSALQEGLRARGYTGKNVEFIDTGLVNGYPLLLPAAEKLAASRVDVIVTSGRTAATAAMKATSTIPVVAMMATDPVEAGFADSLARPGKNLTGVISINVALSAKRLELLKRIVPGARVVGVPYNPKSAGEANSFKGLEALARTVNLQLKLIPVTSPEEFDSALSGAGKLGFDAFAPAPSTQFVANAGQFVAAVRKSRLPAIYHVGDFTRAGGLASYGTNQVAVFTYAAALVDKILKGARPAEIPIEQATTFELLINRTTANSLGIAIPQDLLLQADEVIG